MSRDEIEAIKNMIKGYRDSVRKVKLEVLIFGPGQKNTDSYAKMCYVKRLEMKKVLQANDHIAILPEEACEKAKKELKEYSNVSDYERYLIQHHCDIAVFLYVPNCPGVDHELSEFSVLPECVGKIYFFYANDCNFDPKWPLNDKIGFVRGGGGYWDNFCQKDIAECNVSKKVLEIADDMRRFLAYCPHIKYKGV